MPIVIAAVTLLGLAIGSFLNVVIYRLPSQSSLSSPPSACPRCDQSIRVRHNIPVLGWLLLRGRCADCSAPISVRYPLVEFVTAVLFVTVTLRLHSLHKLGVLPAFLWFAAIGVALTMIDIDHHRLPDSIVLPSYPILGILLTLGAVVDDAPAALVRSIIGGLALYLGYLVLAVAYPAGMGFGDVKLAGLVGAVLGFISFPALIVGAFAAFLVGGLVGIGVLISRRGSRKTAIPFGPFMLVGTLISVLASTQIAQLYTDLTFRT